MTPVSLSQAGKSHGNFHSPSWIPDLSISAWVSCIPFQLLWQILVINKEEIMGFTCVSCPICPNAIVHLLLSLPYIYIFPSYLDSCVWNIYLSTVSTLIQSYQFLINYAFVMYVWEKVLAPLPIGFAVFMVHLATIPITGTGINPARSFGAAVIFNQDKPWDDHVSIYTFFHILTSCQCVITI